ncbi:alpha-L-arabinofuranosidase C-terminal domain-containing protein [Parabacteroides bouchesdurhonensis]|uniref:alpha-L-arabinofuranosidase C-terminal domain-containing protein n=1 Tax=Parabacteroides bouchesdurhonensis TaxID=1936995 RepID=UPI000C82F9FE|nr:alpha-L-arabinofuranosidase C-terminal domain-containing protein [Parabacteroides bouchesdurhonensis]
MIKFKVCPQIDISGLHLFLLFLCLISCKPEMPVTSIISIDAENLAFPVNKNLYGLSFEEINHAIDGGIYAELIQNRSFEDGIIPLNCAYDASRNHLITPNGWSIPFIKADSIPGWHRLSPNTYICTDNKDLINEKNRRSLLVAVSASSITGRGGVVAEGYKGIPIRKGEQYNLSLFVKGINATPKKIYIALEDSSKTTVLSDVMNISTFYGWRRFRHTFTANADADNAVLTISTDSSAVFGLDVVSLFPKKTWKDSPNGLRSDLMEKVSALAPRFIRFPGGSFVEGYTAGTYPVWRETIGDIAERKHFWNVWAYGTTNGMGFHEYLQMCEDLNAEPVYVINSGVTSQSRRPRYEDITAMDLLVKDALDAIAYANSPTDSIYGAMRARNGHPQSFNLKYIEIGSENYGQEYTKRFTLFRNAIKEVYPDITVISSSFISRKNRADWVDSHFYSDKNFFISNYGRYAIDKRSRNSSGVFIGEFGTATGKDFGTLRDAIGEACFLIGVEDNPDVVKRLAYAPVFANANFECNRPALLAFNNKQIVASPSYYMLQLFANNRGDEVLKTKIDTYHRPQVIFGRAAIELFDNSYEIKDARINGVLINEATIRTGGWQVNDGVLIPDANHWNYLLIGDSAVHDCEFTATVCRTKGSGQIQFRLRDNGITGEQSNYIGMTIGSGKCELYHQAGSVRDSLAAPKPFVVENNRCYKVKLVCKNEQIRCYIDDVLLHEASLLPLPSLVSVATLDKETNTVLLKVVNTTEHEEKTELKIHGLNVKNEADIIQITGLPEAGNTFSTPDAIVPVEKHISFSLGGSMICNFPPNSITLVKLVIE